MSTQKQPNAELRPDASSAPSPEVANFFHGCSEGRRYTVHEIIGKGSYGIVAAATDNSTGQRVAIKKIQRVFDSVPDATRILREIILLRQLKHSDVVDILHVMLPPDPTSYHDIFVVFELFESDLHTVIEANDDLTPDHHKVFLYQLLRGLNFIHQMGVLHRDLKPKNILANSNCKLKICDLGLARPYIPQQASEQPVFFTDYVATRWYRAPELCGCFYGFYSQAVDVWSLGCIFAEILLGKPLFPGRNVVDQLNKITDLLGKPSDQVIEQISNNKTRAFLHALPAKEAQPFELCFPGVDPQGLDLLRRMLAFDPADRPTCAEALQHPYFERLPDASTQATTTLSRDCFEFEQCQLTERDVRELIYLEVLHYHPQVRAIHTAGATDHARLMAMLVDQFGPFPPATMNPPVQTQLPSMALEMQLAQQMMLQQQLQLQQQAAAASGVWNGVAMEHAPMPMHAQPTQYHVDGRPLTQGNQEQVPYWNGNYSAVQAGAQLAQH